ncbi:MAG: trimeric intracellular cation channel family protein [Rickettsiales bacterium]
MELLVQSQIMYYASLVGGVAFALSGFLAGTKKNLDWMGLFILSFLTANGGGILRDVLVDRTPVILQTNEPFFIALSVTVFASLLRLGHRSSIENRWLFVICDAVGLVAFAITGALVGLSVHAPFFGFVALAFLTATGGAILRDILVNNIPEVLHGGFYGSIAILVAVAIYILDRYGMLGPLNLMGIFLAGLMLRLIAYRYNWQLPKHD